MSRKHDAKMPPVYVEGGGYRANRDFLRGQIYEKRDAELETEIVHHLGDRSYDATNIVRHFNVCNDRFITPSSPDFARACIAPGRKAPKKLPVPEITPWRLRSYLVDVAIELPSICETRQEHRPYGLYKQTAKWDAGDAGGECFDRWEQAALLLSPGFNLAALPKERRRLVQKAEIGPAKPGIEMLSQRIRLPYALRHRPGVVLELAVEPVHAGRTPIGGFTWNEAKTDTEIVVGPKNPAERARILSEEGEYLREHFPLIVATASSPSPGFAALRNDLSTPSGRAAFARLSERPEPVDKVAMIKAFINDVPHAREKALQAGPLPRNF